jgi:Ca-activated chloride channel family protein
MQSQASLAARGGDNLVYHGMKFTGDLRGLMFEAEVEQRFQNPGEKNLEVAYTFPLSWGAVLLGMEAVLGGTHLSGVAVEKKEAEARYEETLSEGNAAIMLEKNRDGSYTVNLGNLAAGEECVVKFRYAQLLRFEQRGMRLVIPSVIAPRYGDPVRDGGLMPHQAAGHDLLAEYPLEMEIRLHGVLMQARVASPSHPVRMESRLDALVVTLARNAALDRDFVLVLDKLEHDTLVVAGKDMAQEGRYAVLASFCPRLTAPSESPSALPPELEDAATADPPAALVKILVDCSGSMSGDSIAAARAALVEVVAQLRSGDKFSLSRFGSDVEHRSRGLWKAEEPSRSSAREWCLGLQADMGGTRMKEALASTFKLNHATAAGSACDVLLVTDGEIYAIDGVIAAARRSGHRIFAVGIGSSPAEGNLRRLAEATGGACDFVAPGEEAQPAILRMFARLRSPQVNDLAISWPDGMEPDWVSPVSEALFDGDTLNVFALTRNLPAGEIRLNGKLAATGKPVTVAHATFAGELADDATISRLAAATRCAVVEDDEDDEDDKADKDAAHLAVAYQLVTEHTNFLMLHARAEGDKAADMPELHKVAQMTPAGWGGMGSSVRESCRRMKSSVMERRIPMESRYQINCFMDSDSDSSADQEPSFSEMTNSALQSLSPREQEIVRMRYGLNETGKEYTLKEVGEIFHVTRERIRQIEEKALLKLRSPYRSNKLRECADFTSVGGDTDRHTGLTPLGLSARLRQNPHDNWQERISFSDTYILYDWLNCIVVGDIGVADRHDAQRAFMFLLSLPEVREALENGEKPFQTRKDAILAAIASAVADGRLDEQGKAAALAIVEDLADMTATEWPQAVLGDSM